MAKSRDREVSSTFFYGLFNSVFIIAGCKILDQRMWFPSVAVMLFQTSELLFLHLGNFLPYKFGG